MAKVNTGKLSAKMRARFWRWHTNATERDGKFPDPEAVAAWGLRNGKRSNKCQQ